MTRLYEICYNVKCTGNPCPLKIRYVSLVMFLRARVNMVSADDLTPMGKEPLRYTENWTKTLLANSIGLWNLTQCRGISCHQISICWENTGCYWPNKYVGCQELNKYSAHCACWMISHICHRMLPSISQKIYWIYRIMYGLPWIPIFGKNEVIRQ